jgi:preprotein translocase SecE subunit
VARNRQRSKQRQQERREARLAERGGPAPEVDGAARADAVDARERERLERVEREADLEAGAPPQDLGTSEDTLQHGPHADDDDDLVELDLDEEYDFEDEEQPLDGGAEPAVRGPRGVRGDGPAVRPGEPTHRGRGRLIAFLIAVWAELKRVQWPDRKQLTQMTGIVLVFVLIAGGYLGLLDAIFSRIIKSIL